MANGLTYPMRSKKLGMKILASTSEKSPIGKPLISGQLLVFSKPADHFAV